MPNSFDLDPRSPSMGRLRVLGACFVAIATLIASVMVAESRGEFDDLVRVRIELANIGDGLPQRSDVKFHGALVGWVTGVTPSQTGGPNMVHASIQPRYAAGIPDSVTARVVPTNLFSVSSVQLVDNAGESGSLKTGAVIAEDRSLPTVLFQNVLAKFREVMAAVGRKPDPQSLGVLAALSAATDGRGEELKTAGRQLDEVLKELNQVVAADDTGPTTLSALTAAAQGLSTASPELFDALAASVRPMQTFAEKRIQLEDFLTGGLHTTGTLGGAFDNQTDRLIAISTQFTPVIGVLADHAGEFHGISTRMQTLAGKFVDEAWNPETNMFTGKAIIAFTPSRTYVRADCPRYGALEGPSCQTAPETPTAPALLPALEGMGYPPLPGLSENRPNFGVPRQSMPDSVQGPPAPAPPPWVLPPLPPGSAHLPLGPPAPAAVPPPGPVPPPIPAPAPAPVPGPLPAEAPFPAQPAAFGGNVGPVGSAEEAQQLSIVLGEPVTPSTQLLLGPVARGMTVHAGPDSGVGS